MPEPNQKPPTSKRRFKPKVKTGCHTCRIRRVKCDEARPSCKRCVSTGRTCDGYPSVFQVVAVGPSTTPSPPSSTVLAIQSRPSPTLYRPKSSSNSPDEINKLAFCFTLKDGHLDIGYRDEARATLSKLSDPAIRSALASLQAIQDEYEAQTQVSSGNGRWTIARASRGLGAYNTAISSLASRLATEPSQDMAHAALLCCQLFISIELTMGDVASAVRHFLSGLRIMHQCRSRPSERGNLPSLDLFAIKLFASGCPERARQILKRDQTPTGPIPAIAAIPLRDQARGELAVLSIETSQFLEKVSGSHAPRTITELYAWKDRILGSLESWEYMYAAPLPHECVDDGKLAKKERLNIVFSLLLHGVLKVIVSLAMSNSPAQLDALAPDFEALTRMSCIATDVMSRHN